MLTRFAKRAASSRALQSLGSQRMDPKLWGNLPDEIHLKIYSALLIRDFYNLRVVCKEWNILACERRSVSDLVHKPFFRLFSLPEVPDVRHFTPVGTLAYNVSSGRWIWNLYSLVTLGRWDRAGVYEVFIVEGLVFDSTAISPSPLPDPAGMPQRCGRCGFMLEIPQEQGSVLGMMVDTSTLAYTCKFIVGSCRAETLILDSQTNTWVPKPSRMVRCRAPSPSASSKCCVQCDGRMYIWADSDEMQVYSPEDDEWSALDPPPRYPSAEEFRGLGHWQRELYAVTNNKHGSLSVWKLVNPRSQEWSEYERIPSKMLAYLLHRPALMAITIAHCGEFFLMHVLTRARGAHLLGRRYVLFNISNRRWETVTLRHLELLQCRF